MFTLTSENIRQIPDLWLFSDLRQWASALGWKRCITQPLTSTSKNHAENNKFNRRMSDQWWNSSISGSYMVSVLYFPLHQSELQVREDIFQYSMVKKEPVVSWIVRKDIVLRHPRLYSGVIHYKGVCRSFPPFTVKAKLSLYHVCQ